MSFTDLSVGSASRHAEPGTEALFPRNPSIPSLKYAITFFSDTKIQRNYESLVEKDTPLNDRFQEIALIIIVLTIFFRSPIFTYPEKINNNR